MAANGTGAARGGASRSVPPNGRRPSPAVYRRRRLAALVLVLVLVALLVLAGWWIASVFGEDKPKAEGQAPVPVASSASPSVSPSPKPAATGACDESDISVSAATDAPSYAAGENPTLILEVENTGDSDCEVDVGTEAMEFIVTSGEDRIFSSKDCAVETGELMRTIAPGESERAQFTWERQRSAPGCTAVNANPQPGTYVLTTRLGSHKSEKVIFDLQ
jgi:hypothetical protein